MTACGGNRQVGMAQLVNTRPGDSVRIDYGVKATTMPVTLVFNVDANLKQCREIGQALIVYRVSEECWLAECGGDFVGRGPSPIQAIAAMERE